MNCYVCSKNTNGWVTTSRNSSTFTFCSYDCYKLNPTFIPTKSVYKSLGHNNLAPIIHHVKKDDSHTFKFLDEGELMDLTNDQYINYNINLDEHCLLNTNRSLVYHEGLSNDAYTRKIEGEIYTSESSQSEDEY